MREWKEEEELTEEMLKRTDKIEVEETNVECLVRLIKGPGLVKEFKYLESNEMWKLSLLKAIKI